MLYITALRKILTDEYGFVYRETVKRETKLLDGSEPDFLGCHSRSGNLLRDFRRYVRQVRGDLRFRRQTNFEDRPSTRLTIDFDPPTVIIDNPLTDGQTQAHSSSFLRGKKRLENLWQIRFRDAKAGILHRYHGHRSHTIGLRCFRFHG